MKLGITGTIASGKTTTAVLLKEKGIPVFNSDHYAKLAYEKDSEIYDEMVDRFGNDILDDDAEIDLEKLADIIFHDEEKRKAVDDIVHPFVREGVIRFFKNNRGFPIVAAEVPLLFEAGFEDLFDKIIVVTCDEEIAINRLVENRNYTYEDALSRIQSQISPEIQISKADRVLYNNTHLEDLDAQVNQLINDLKGEMNGN